jgi:hypothetical protein
LSNIHGVMHFLRPLVLDGDSGDSAGNVKADVAPKRSEQGAGSKRDVFSRLRD